MDRIAERYAEGVFDMIFADPPYFLSNGGITCHAGKMVSVNKGEWDKSRGPEENHNFNREWLARCQKVLKPNGTIWVSGTAHIIHSVGFAITSIPEFTYGRVLRSVRMIDAIWFNSRGFPASVIEIEHTTDFRGAFEKFSELVDFRVDMIAVGHSARQRQFEDVIGRNVYEPLRTRLRYLDYEHLALLHSSTLTLAEAEKNT
jgi:hypothetical protein